MAKIFIELNGTLTPVTREELFQMAADGRITPETKLRYDNMPMVCKKVKGLFSNANTDLSKKAETIFSNAKNDNSGNPFRKNTDRNGTNLNSQNFNSNKETFQNRNLNSSYLNKQNHDSSDSIYSFSEPLIVLEDEPDTKFSSANSSHFRRSGFNNTNHGQANPQNPNFQNSNHQNPNFQPLSLKTPLQETDTRYSQNHPPISTQRQSNIFRLRNILLVVGIILSTSLFTAAIFSCRSQKDTPSQREVAAGNSSAGNSSAGNSSAGNPSAGNPSAGNSPAGNSSAGNSSAGNSSGKTNTPQPGNNISSPDNVPNGGQQASVPNAFGKGSLNESGNGQQASKEKPSEKNATGTDPSSAPNDSKSPSAPTAESQISEEDFSLDKYEYLASPFLLTLDSKKQNSVFLDLIVENNLNNEELTNIKKLNDSPTVKSLMVTFKRKVSDSETISLKDLSKLEVVYLEGETKVTNNGLEAIAAYPNLKVFSVASHEKDKDQWDKNGLTAFTNSKNLRSFSLVYSDFRDKDLDFLKQMKNLYELNLGNNYFLSGDFIEYLPDLLKLRILNLSKVDTIDLAAMEFLGKMEHLTKLVLTSPLINDEAFKPVLNLSNLKTLEIDGCSLSKNSYEIIGQLQNLEKLSVGGESFDNSCAQTLKNLKNMKYFEISDTSISDSGIEVISNYSQLKSLVLFNNNDITNLALNILPKLQELEEFSISNSPQITNAGCHSIFKCKKIKSLSLLNCQEITGDIFHFIGEMPSLTELFFTDSKNEAISEEKLLPILNFTGLTSLTLNTKNISDRFIAGMKGLTNLKRLSLANVSCTSASIDKLADVNSLAYVYFIDCPKIIPADVIRLRKLMPGRVIDFYSGKYDSSMEPYEDTKKEIKALNTVSNLSLFGIKLGDNLDVAKARYPKAEIKNNKRFNNSVIIKVGTPSSKYKNVVFSFYKEHCVRILCFHRLNSSSEYYDSGKILLRKFKCLTEDAHLDSLGLGNALFMDKDGDCSITIFLSREEKENSFDITTMYSHKELAELQDNDENYDYKENDEDDKSNDNTNPKKEKPYSFITQEYDRMQEITWFSPKLKEFTEEKGSQTYSLYLYFGKEDNGELSLRLRTSYSDKRSDLSQSQWIFYDKVQFLGSNGVNIFVKTDYPKKETEVTDDGVKEWSDNSITSQREEFFKLIQSEDVYVKFYGKYNHEYKLDFLPHFVFKKIASKYMLELNNSKGEVGK